MPIKLGIMKSYKSKYQNSEVYILAKRVFKNFPCTLSTLRTRNARASAFKAYEKEISNSLLHNELESRRQSIPDGLSKSYWAKLRFYFFLCPPNRLVRPFPHSIVGKGLTLGRREFIKFTECLSGFLSSPKKA